MDQNKRIQRKDFIKSVAFSLIETHVACRSTIKTLPRELRFLIQRFTQSPHEEENRPEPEQRKRRCALCPQNVDRKYTKICAYCKKTICPRHCKPVFMECED